jgi:hypothetical protein
VEEGGRSGRFGSDGGEEVVNAGADAGMAAALVEAIGASSSSTAAGAGAGAGTERAACSARESRDCDGWKKRARPSSSSSTARDLPNAFSVSTYVCVAWFHTCVRRRGTERSVGAPSLWQNVRRFDQGKQYGLTWKPVSLIPVVPLVLASEALCMRSLFSADASSSYS